MADQEKSQWKPIPNFSWYLISNKGQVYDRVNNRIVSQNYNSCGYKRVGVVDDEGNRRQMLVHRLVYMAFIGEIPKGMQINHKDECKVNNDVENLEVMTPSQNINYGTANIRRAQVLRITKCKPVNQYSMNGKLLNTFESLNDAECAGFVKTHIIDCCKGRKTSYKGYKWQYAEGVNHGTI